MALSRSSAFFDRLSSPRRNNPLLPIHETHRRPEEYDLQELSPGVEDALLSEDAARHERLTIRSPSPMDPWEEPASPTGSASKFKERGNFLRGPPPPITASMMVSKPSPPARSRDRATGKSGNSQSQTTGSVLFDGFRQQTPSHTADSVWRSLQRREKTISGELQDLLDMQASSLVAGSGPVSSNTSELDTFSDDGSSTPTATFYSTVTSRSRMVASLDNPTRANARGDVIPVRQPKRSKPKGLHFARSGLGRAMTALANVKYEEDSHIATAISERKKALAHVKKLVSRQEGISTELEFFSDDSEEPLAKELRELSNQHEELDKEIRDLEERLVGMRNRRRWLGRKVEDVRNRRDAGLSGYRGALQEVESKIASVVQRPRIEPLDMEVLTQGLGPDQETTLPEDFTTGEDFLQLIPGRRTAEMAVDWWEGELKILEARQKQVDKDRDALEAGLDLWHKSTTLVSDFEADLRRLMKGGAKGKNPEGSPPAQEVMQNQLPRMAQIINDLEEHLKQAESNNWNLLICAIGAELEAFKEAEGVLRVNLGGGTPPAPKTEKEEARPDVKSDESPPVHQATNDDYPSESDNEVPPDLLVSINHQEQEDSGPTKPAPDSPPAFRRESDSNVPPPEFLAEHDPESEAESQK